MRLSTGSSLGLVLIGTLIGTTCLGGGLRAADCNRNDVEDAQDIAAGTSHDCNQNGVPDECDMSPLVSFNVTGSELEKRPTFVTSADLDGDGDKDLVVANTPPFGEPERATLAVLFNSGSGTFGAAQDFGVGQSPISISSVAAADLDGDGDQDLAVAGGRRR